MIRKCKNLYWYIRFWVQCHIGRHWWLGQYGTDIEWCPQCDRTRTRRAK